MNSISHSSFSIDSITRETSNKTMDGNYKTDADGTQNGGIYRRTPSPSDSGMESDPSPSRPLSNGNADYIAKVLSSVEKMCPQPKSKFAKVDTVDKPAHSYIALISMAILSTQEHRMLLGDIYQYVMDNFTYYNNEEKAWRNSIRHNLSLNECFVKVGRADNGKGNYWAIHPACIDDFANGDFRRRQARRRARKSLKETPQQHLQSPNSLRYNMGYVQMTSSHLPYHPYNSPSLYFSPSAALAQTSQQTSSSPNPSPYYPACSVNGSSSTTASVMSAAAQTLFREQSNTAAMTMQAFAAQQQLANSLQFPNW